MMHKPEFIIPDWPAPANVKALQTTRAGGISTGSYASLNLGDHVKDNPLHVAHNRQSLSPFLPTEPVWLQQVHGIRVIDASTSSCLETADASFSTRKEVVCVTMTADCLPVLLCDKAGTVVAAIHAGWRSLCDGVIEAAVEVMPGEASHLMAWLGPAIGPEAFEVGGEVRQQFILHDAQAEAAFRPHGNKWLGDLYTIARQRLQSSGITRIYGGGRCTYTEPESFFSFRRDGDTGRMATFIWLE
ncbi:peptidoglycan editing factor PgeF [Methylophilus sp. Leaf408]|uniref:peptidoglycan editing factor PgeF n=1 Tax=Methylophilus sp. Leaf408 TaxID=2876561 RepID=UPI001E29B321|nr:peptidoglycan editing factor PgeF [Methylophilus sp. Leaf408]